MSPSQRGTPPKRRSAEGAATRVVAVFHHRAYAERVAEELEREDLAGAKITLEDRRATDDPPEQPAAPDVEPTERRRDSEVAGHVFRNTVGLSVLYAVAGIVIAGLIGLLLFGWWSTGFWIAVAVGGVTGSVLGGIQGGIGAAMSESEKEEGTLLIVETADAQAAKRAEAALRKHDPARVDVEPHGRLAR